MQKVLPGPKISKKSVWFKEQKFVVDLTKFYLS